MFARLFAVATLAALVVAGPLAARDGGECNTGNIYCCNSGQYNTNTINQLLSNVPVAGAAGILAAINCNKVGLANVGGEECQQNPMCCSNNEANGLVVVQCSPIEV